MTIDWKVFVNYIIYITTEYSEWYSVTIATRLVWKELGKLTIFCFLSIKINIKFSMSLIFRNDTVDEN